MVVDHITGSATKRSEPIYAALQTGRLRETARAWRFTVERRGRRVEIVEIRLYAEDEGAAAALEIIANIAAERERAVGVLKRKALCRSIHLQIGDFSSMARITYSGA